MLNCIEIDILLIDLPSFITDREPAQKIFDRRKNRCHTSSLIQFRHCGLGSFRCLLCLLTLLLSTPSTLTGFPLNYCHRRWNTCSCLFRIERREPRFDKRRKNATDCSLDVPTSLPETKLVSYSNVSTGSESDTMIKMRKKGHSYSGNFIHEC